MREIMYTRILTGAAILALGASAALADYKLTILHTNDFHSRFTPISKYDGGCGEGDNAEGKCFGGSARLVTAINDARARSGNSILVDGGDQFQGSLFYTYYKGKLAAEMMNKMGYTGMTVGNHEFDDGPEVLRGFIDAVNFPILMSNADISRENLLKDVLKKSVIIEQAGEKIGLIGLTPTDTDEIASPGPNVVFSDPIAAVQGEVDNLTAMGVNKIIVLSHSTYQVDQAIAANTTGVDVIVGGHSNTLLSNTNERAEGPYPTMVGNTAIVQAYAYGKFLGELDVTFDDGGNIIQAVGEPLVMDSAVAEDSSTLARIAKAAEPLNELRAMVIGKSSALIEGNRKFCRVQECEMGNLIADAMLDRVAAQGVTISLANAGNIRASIEPGAVTMGQVLEVLPFQNTLATFETSGQVIIDALENGVSQVEDVKGRFPQVAGLRYTWDSSIAANEGRIVEVLVGKGNGFVPIDPAATYMVVTNNYIRSGGDGYKMFRSAKNAYDYGPNLENVMAEYMAAQDAYVPYLDGRITRK